MEVKSKSETRTGTGSSPPPYTTVFLIPDEPPNLSHSSLIWTASSRVGARTRTIGPSPRFRYGCNTTMKQRIRNTELEIEWGRVTYHYHSSDSEFMTRSLGRCEASPRWAVADAHTSDQDRDTRSFLETRSHSHREHTITYSGASNGIFVPR